MNASARTAAGPAPQTLTIGRVAKAAGLGVETIRFYEREGLLPAPSRRRSGYRSYDPGVVVRLQFIRRAKDLGFTLGEIKSLLDLRQDPSATAADVKRQARLKIDDVERRIRSLQEIRDALLHLVTQCRGQGPLSECPIVDAMEHGLRTACDTKGPMP
ncbi:Mercuric resistance operon regulatory protein [Caulifigura coniformis]|uniref:Mercuric resistance operon regulatory protein n=1 Tax=Caulifigura coniformis TaxID=2527983 RepID=A0A517SI69_9PLAN|nr:MerR family DNA-binding protein [Caulifigura coniformis]QDT55818.1 Mercuric resistance operon regulatory protein [Caulifigura coniformis]